MTTPQILVLVGLFGCTPLEERVELYGNGWCAPTRTETSACVLDGDTFDLVECGIDDGDEGAPERVRLIGIDAPEISHPGVAADCYGDEATDELASVLAGRSLRLEFDESCSGAFGRTLAWVFIQGDTDDPLIADLETLDGLGIQEDGSFDLLINEWMVRAGHARLYENEEEHRYEARLYEAQRQAAVTGQGLWGVCEES
jgi:endonuclease YncB( thermonuclease family)